MASAEKYADKDVVIRDAKKEDMVTVAEMIQELADFEKMSDGPKLSVRDLEQHGFESNPPAFRCKIAEVAKASPQPIVGYALYFPTYSTWEGPSMMLEDLYVRPKERRRGVGERLFNSVAKEAVASGSSRLDFHVLEWNPARDFYVGKGAEDLSARDHWRYFRLAGERLSDAAGQ